MRHPTRQDAGEDNHFVFDTAWAVAAPAARVRDVLVDLERYPEWWPQIRAVAKLGDDDAMVLCRSVLPYTLELRLHAVCRELPTLRVEVAGDLRGSVAWTVTEDGDAGCVVRAHQEVELVPFPGVVVAAARPVLTWNHHRMMRGCAAGLAARVRGWAAQ